MSKTRKRHVRNLIKNSTPDQKRQADELIAVSEKVQHALQALVGDEYRYAVALAPVELIGPDDDKSALVGVGSNCDPDSSHHDPLLEAIRDHAESAMRGQGNPDARMAHAMVLMEQATRAAHAIFTCWIVDPDTMQIRSMAGNIEPERAMRIVARALSTGSFPIKKGPQVH